MKIKIKYSELKKKNEEELLSMKKDLRVFLVTTKQNQKSLGFSPEAGKGNNPKLQREIKKNIARINKRLKEI